MSGVIKKDLKRGTYGFVVDLGQKPDGSRRQVRRRGFKTQRAADEALTALKSQYNKGEVVLPGKSRGTFDNVILSGGPYDPICTTTIHG